MLFPLLTSEEAPLSPPYPDLYRRGGVPVHSVTMATLSRFLELSLAVSAWKQSGDMTWALRCNPSSGNLHPTEGYLLLGRGIDARLSSGVYHYAPREHALEQRVAISDDAFSKLASSFPAGAFFFGLTSIYWREAWKYGERAFRYCQHDIGHAIGAARISAATLGWQMVLLEDVGDDQLQTLLGIGGQGDSPHAEGECPDCLAVVWPLDIPAQSYPARALQIPLGLDPVHVNRIAEMPWRGTANRLSRDLPLAWDLIDDVHRSTWKDVSQDQSVLLESEDRPVPGESPMPGGQDVSTSVESAAKIIRGRRSAVALDGHTEITADCLYHIMERVMPHSDRSPLGRPIPWDTIRWDPCIHLALFVHRVEDLQPGLYCLVRDHGTLTVLKSAMDQEFLWSAPPGCPTDLPLFLLQEGDTRRVAVQVSCHQDIAGDGAFSLGMIAEFEPRLRETGPWFYRRLFWEAGMLGQVLYLEAEAAGIRGTGIGCFFDDPLHQVLGLQGLHFQSLYHFTMGGAVEDRRLTTLPAYPTVRGEQ